MNRFALLDSDNEDEKPKTASVTVDKKKKAEPAASAKPAAPTVEAPKKVVGDNKPKGENKKPQVNKGPVPGQKTEKASKPTAEAPAAAGGDDGAEVSGKTEGRRDARSHGKAPRTRFEKRQDESDPLIKPDNRIRDGAHTNTKRRPSKNTEKHEVEVLAKEAEKDPESAEAPAEPVEAEPEEPKAPEVPAEPEVVTYSLEEYQRRREEARAKSAILAEAKAVRAVEELTGVKLKEEEGPGVYTGVAKTSKAAKTTQRSTAKAVVTDLGFKTELEQEPRQPREERRSPANGTGRGSGRGHSGPRTGGRGSGGKGPRVDLADVNAFPSL